MKKAIVSVIGKDRKGIIAGVCHTLYELNVNVEDITQTIMQDYFTMIMLVEIEDGSDFAEISKRLTETGKNMGVQISIQHEDIFNAMHRI